MSEIFKSASKIVFILITITACAALFTNKIDPKDFMILASMAFGFYFSNKGDTSGNVPYLGK